MIRLAHYSSAIKHFMNFWHLICTTFSGISTPSSSNVSFTDTSSVFLFLLRWQTMQCRRLYSRHRSVHAARLHILLISRLCAQEERGRGGEECGGCGDNVGERWGKLQKHLDMEECQSDGIAQCLWIWSNKSVQCLWWDMNHILCDRSLGCALKNGIKRK